MRISDGSSDVCSSDLATLQSSLVPQMSAKTRREYMKFALPGKPLESSLDQGDQRAGKAVSATALGQLDRGPDLDFVNDLSQFRVTGILALAQDTGQVLELAERHLAQRDGQAQFLEADRRSGRGTGRGKVGRYGRITG